MAKIILGTIVTSIRGSIGGNTFKKTKNGFSLGLKSFGGSTAKNLLNPRLSKIATIFSYWRGLTELQKTGWNNLALTIQFPDKNGVPRYLTGRQLFSKLNIQVASQGFFYTDSTYITFIVPEMNIIDAAINYSVGEAAIVLNASTFSANFSLYAQALSYAGASVDIRKAKRLISSSIPMETSVEFGQVFFQMFPNVSSGDVYALIVVPINPSGVKGVQISTVTTII